MNMTRHSATGMSAKMTPWTLSVRQFPNALIPLVTQSFESLANTAIETGMVKTEKGSMH